MGNIYSTGTVLAGIAVTITKDLLQFGGVAAALACIHEVKITQSNIEGDAAAEMLPISIARTTTLGTAGTAIVPVGAEPSDPAGAHAATIDAVATVSTSLSVLASEGMNLQAGYHYLPAPEDRLWVPNVVTEGIVWQCAAPDASTIFHISVVYEEFKVT